VLDPDVTAQEPVVGVGDVAGGVDVRVGGPQALVDGDAVVNVEAGRDGEAGVGGDLDADQDHVGGHLAAIGQPDAGHGPTRADDLCDLLV
jgi:hypothetical protein